MCAREAQVRDARACLYLRASARVKGPSRKRQSWQSWQSLSDHFSKP